ncbi:MAG: cation:proton antiporter [Patescibacteria group bacterium]
MPGGISELAVVMGLAAVLGIILRLFKQPLILAYVATGACIGLFGLFQLPDKETFQIFSDLGIMFLLFLVGLEMNYASLKVVGKASIIVGLAQIMLTALIALGIALIFRFSLLESAYISAALTFSSTIIVVKYLSDKKDVNSLYGKISVGVLLVQDAVAILTLFFLTSFLTESAVQVTQALTTIGFGILLFMCIFLIGRFLLPPLMRSIGRSPELVFVVSLAWLFLVVGAVHQLGFSLEIGGFLAGVALAQSAEHMQIAHRIGALRDFFLLIFFVILGSSLIYADFQGLFVPILTLTLFVLIGKPLAVMGIMGFLGYRKRTSWLTSVTLGQVSEFSLILVALGLQLEHISNQVVSLVTAVAILTITFSTYEMMYADKVANKLSSLLSVFERKVTKEPHWSTQKIKKPIILIGAHRTGQSILANLPMEEALVIDFDPELIQHLKQRGYKTLFGDISDPEVFEAARFGQAELVISTSPDIEDNVLLLEKIRKLRRHPLVILRAETEREAEVLYKQGADYVLLPHFTSGYYIGLALSKNRTAKKLHALRKKDEKMLNLQVVS